MPKNLLRNEAIELASKYVGVGVIDRLLDRAFWLGDDVDLMRWIEALEAIEAGDAAPLIAALESDWPCPPTARRHMADLLRRYDLKPKPGNAAAPSYNLTEVETRQLAITNRIRDCVKAGAAVKDALEQVGKEYSLKRKELETIAKAYAGKLGSFRRMKQRLF